jgi:hypothetical protein
LNPETDAECVTELREPPQAARQQEATMTRKNLIWIGLIVAALGTTGCSDVAGPALIEDDQPELVAPETPSEQADRLRERNKKGKQTP